MLFLPGEEVPGRFLPVRDRVVLVSETGEVRVTW